MFSIAIFLAAMGITLLEMAEAAAVGVALYADAGYKAFVWVSLGAAIVLIVTFLVGSQIASLPVVIVRVFAALLLLYFGLRLAKSARRAVERSKSNKAYAKETHEKGIFYTGFSVGAIEAFEAAIVLIALIPIDFDSTLFGLIVGLIIVIVGTFLLHSHIRRIKQANMKMVVSALLLAFSMFWFAESVVIISDLLLVPLFVLFVAVVHFYANRHLKP